MSALTKVEASCCPWCRCRIERDDAVVQVGHEALHVECSRDYEAQQDDAPLVFGTVFEWAQRRNLNGRTGT